MTRWQKVVFWVMVRVRWVLYRLGRRPRPGTIWYSPSLAMIGARACRPRGLGYRTR